MSASLMEHIATSAAAIRAPAEAEQKPAPALPCPACGLPLGPHHFFICHRCITALDPAQQVNMGVARENRERDPQAWEQAKADLLAQLRPIHRRERR